MQWIESPKDKITQGSIIDGIDWGYGEDNPLSIVLSNACDIENNKCSYLIVLGLLPALDTIHKSSEFQNKVNGADEQKGLSKKAWEAVCKFIVDYIHNKNICRYYFIDFRPIIDVDPMFVDFQMIKSIPINQIGKLENIGQLSSPFVEQMIVHFAGYTSRIPSDRVSKNEENEYIREFTSGYHQK